MGVTINILSYIKYSRYSRKNKKKVEDLQMSSIHNRPTTSREVEQFKQRARKERRIERNMFRDKTNKKLFGK